MGLYSVISHLTLKMRKEDRTNARSLGKWVRRVLGIAQDLEKSHDVAKQQKLQIVVEDVAERLASAESSATEGTQLAPRVYQKRKEIIFEADNALDTIQPPPKGYPEEMLKAMSNDERALGSMLEDLSQADDGLLKEVSRLVPSTERSNGQKMHHKVSLEGIDSRRLTSAPSRARILPNEERAYERLGQKLAQYKEGKRDPSIIIAISDMESEKGELHAHVIPHDHTFFALADTLTDFNSDSFLPDFWSKETDPTHNCITKSGVVWEWQDPSNKVINAINKEGHIGIETVCKGVEYVVVLVKKGEVENGIPIEIPRICRQRAFLHLQRHFPNHIVSQVRRLQLGDDVSDVVFDSRTFRHQTNPLFVELELSIEPTQQNAAVVAEVEMAPRTDKGKGKAIGG